MGVRGEIFSTKVQLQNRTYFFNVKENRLGDLYLNIVESKNRDEGGFERQSVILFAEDLQSFLQGFDEALLVLEKSEREKRRGRKTTSQGDRPRSDGHARSDKSRHSEQPKSFGPKKFGPKPQGQRPQGPKPPSKFGPNPAKKRDGAPPKKKKFVVKKK